MVRLGDGEAERGEGFGDLVLARHRAGADEVGDCAQALVT